MKIFKRILIMALILALTGFNFALAEPTVLDGAAERKIPFHKSYADNPVIAGESSTTGLSFENLYVPIMLVFDNAQNARPLVGVAQADIIFQMPNAGAGATKLIGLFADTIPLQAGSLRSARVPFIELREIYGAALVYAGGPTENVSDELNINRSMRKFDLYQKGLSFNLIGAQQSFESTVDGKGKYYNTMANLQDIRDQMLESDQQFTQKPFLFTDELPTEGVAATDIEVAHFASRIENNEGNPASWARYLYDATKNGYARMVDTGVFSDYSDPDTALVYQNVIVMRVNYRFSGNYVLLPDMVGEGPAEFFIGGKYIAGGWIHPTLESRIVFVDMNGDEIPLQRGKTFIIVGNQTTRVTFSAGE